LREIVFSEMPVEFSLVVPTATDSRALIARAGTSLGPAASLLASLARLRLGEDDRHQAFMAR
jgi:hypothetical protein